MPHDQCHLSLLGVHFPVLLLGLIVFAVCGIATKRVTVSLYHHTDQPVKQTGMVLALSVTLTSLSLLLLPMAVIGAVGSVWALLLSSALVTAGLTMAHLRHREAVTEINVWEKIWHSVQESIEEEEFNRQSRANSASMPRTRSGFDRREPGARI